MSESNGKLKTGFYHATITDWALGQSKEKGTPQFSITFELDAYKGSGGKREDCPTLTRTLFRYITDKTIDYFVSDLKALGYTHDDFDGLEKKSSTAFDFGGIEIEVRLNYETYEGKERERWDLAMGGKKLEVKPLEDDGVSKLNALFGDRLKGLKSNAATPPKKQPAAAAKQVNDEEIPF
jgi:hypothetical protein